jgi:predicted small metal-binding protein
VWKLLSRNPELAEANAAEAFVAAKEGVAVKSFACGDVVPGCEARWVCSSEDEILVNVASHAREAHGLTQITDDLEQAVRGSIVPVG